MNDVDLPDIRNGQATMRDNLTPRRSKAATVPIDPDYITHERDVAGRRDIAFIW
jgi:hypothetical protein